ncbi:histidine phosphatase family protein [Streptomyces sp. NPDC026206]|uniref:histidine phosphatase family protein n=1 Tax=Streptomyces sp. NPDC026206 TaxID=3157089 RepID=UPI0033DC07DC
MTVRVMLISPAPGPALRAARFDDDAPLDEAAVRRAGEAAGALPRGARAFSAPSRRCLQTAAALGLDPAAEPALRDLEAGCWRGRSLEEVAAGEPEAVAAWLADPGAAPHGGETLLTLIARVGAWLEDRVSGDGGRVLAVADPAVIRAAAVHALGLPPQVFWRLDVPPLTLTELSGRAGRWNLRCGRPLTASGPPLD